MPFPGYRPKFLVSADDRERARVKDRLERARAQVELEKRRVDASSGKPAHVRLMAGASLMQALLEFHNAVACAEEWGVTTPRA